MARLSEQLEREAEGARRELAGALDELRLRMTPGQIVDEIIDYARQTPVAEFSRNLVRDIRQYPLPLLLIAAGVAWAVIASSLAQRRAPGRALEPAAAHPIDVWRPDTAAAVDRRQWEVAAVTP